MAGGGGGRPRVAVYSHDTYGLGHLMRSARIARGVVDGFPGCSVLLLTGSPIAHRFHFSPKIDYVKLPSVVKVGPDRYAARELNVSRRRIRQMRAHLIRDAVQFFRPDLLLVDNVPVGMKGELLPALRWLRGASPATQIHLNLRDILDEPEVIRRSWEAQRVYRVFDEFYDAIHVFGCQGIYDAVAAYGLPREKTAYLGYIAPAGDEREGGEPLPSHEGRRTHVLVTVGGGGDGEEILRCVCRLQRASGVKSPYQFHIVTGPLMDEGRYAELEREVAANRGMSLHRYVEHLPAWMAACEVVLSMGGYNTLCEVLSVAQRSVVVPRIYPRREQELRAQAFAARGLVSVIRPDELTAENLDRALADTLRKPPLAAGNGRPPLGGIAALQQRLRVLFEGRRAARPQRRSRGAKSTRERSRGRMAAPYPTLLSRPGIQGARGGRQRGSGGWRFLVRLILALASGVVGVASAELEVGRVQVGFAYGYDTNLLDASDAERDAFERRDSDALFVVDRIEDSFLRGEIECDLETGRLFGMKSKLRGRWERTQFLYNPIKSETAYDLGWQWKLGRGTRVTPELGFRPQVYGRHRRDKDALPGQPEFRAEVHRRWDLGCEIEQRLGGDWEVESQVEWTWKDYNEPFDERDRRRWGLELGASWEASPAVTLQLVGEYRRSRSRNAPDLGKDLSYREWGLRPEVRLVAHRGLPEVLLALETSRRDYTSSDPEDWNHYGREDRHGAFEVGLRRPVSSDTWITLNWTTRWRSAELSSGETIDYDEEGSFSESVVQGGVSWRWEAP
ncbi:MAG: hypothetical protein KAY32_13840 [Candidatus Eisenbacteria sp.]|nr:hypothetical protein [Candidatus Eisenbacteria bacterium]